MLSWQSRILKVIFQLKHLKAKDGPINVAKERKNLEKLGTQFPAMYPAQYQPITIKNIRCEWVIPNDISHDNILMYLHGGGYSFGSIDSHRGLATNIAHISHTKTLLVDYRLAPEHPYPAALDDAITVYHWLLEHHGSKNIFIGGDSAGGGLTLALLLALRDKKVSLPAGAVCLSPWTDLTCSNPSSEKNIRKDFLVLPQALKHCASLYYGSQNPMNPFMSPLYGDLKGLPPLLIQVGSDEMLLDDSLLFAQKAKESGVKVEIEVWEKMQHVWQFGAKHLPEGRKAIKIIGSFINGNYTSSKHPLLETIFRNVLGRKFKFSSSL